MILLSNWNGKVIIIVIYLIFAEKYIDWSFLGQKDDIIASGKINIPEFMHDTEVDEIVVFLFFSFHLIDLTLVWCNDG